MMKPILTYVAVLATFCLFAQQKGAAPIANGQQPTASGTTYAVVVGISDYQDAAIPDLRFADRDAEAFANFLRSPAGGSLDGDHLKVLLNSEATAGRIAEALDGLIEQAKEGDQVIIYFSGHGDVEGKKISQPGFLLCWDSPSRVYMGGGTYSLAYLQEVVTTLSVQTKAKVTVITDACHAGKLAGSQIGGAQLTAANLAKQFANEVKILSCQPGEFSLEGEQWGGGRGAFSYHLVDGLYGLADRNGDGQVSVGEMDRYLEDKVTAEVAPQSQVPILLGNKTDLLAKVNAKLLADLRKNKSGEMQIFGSTESRGFEDVILAKADSTIREMYFAFKKAVSEKRFLTPEADCAEKYYAQLVENEVLSPLRGIMTRNYAAALQDDAQQAMNTMLRTGLTEIYLGGAIEERLYANYPLYLGRAAELLGKEHYLYNTLLARQAFFQGKIAATKEERKQHLLLALERQPKMPHALLELGMNEGYENLDTAKFYIMSAAEQVPGWVLPYVKLAMMYANANFPAEALATIDMAEQLDSTSVLVWYHKAILNKWQGQLEQAEPLFLKVVKGTSDAVCFPCAYMELGSLYMQKGELKKAQVQFQKALALYAVGEGITKGFCNPCAYVNIGNSYIYLDSLAEAIPYFEKAIEADSTFMPAISNIGVVYAMLKNYDEAEKWIMKSIKMQPQDASAYGNLGCVYLDRKRYKEAEEYLLKSYEIDPNNPNNCEALGELYTKTGRYELAEKQLRDALEINPNHYDALRALGILFLKTDRLKDAIPLFEKSISINSKNMLARLGLAAAWAAEGKNVESFDQIEQAIGNGATFEQLQNDEDLALLRALPEWKALMKKHFPNQVKD